MMMFMGAAAINTQVNLLFGVFGLMIGILMVSWFISKWVLRGVVLRREFPDHVMVGRSMVVNYHLENTKRFWPTLSVTISEIDGIDAFNRQPTAYLLHAAPRMTGTVPSEMVPLRRGIVAFDRYQLSTSFPFGFIKRAVDRRAHETIVIMPAIGRVSRELMRQFLSAESSGANVRPSRGGSDDFYGLREYRPGENPRWIYWKRSAHIGTLVLREMTRVSPPKILVIVDTYNPSADVQRATDIERGIAMAATVIWEAMEAGMPVGLVVHSDQWVTIAPNRGKRHRVDLLSVLARLEPNTRHNQSDTLDAARELMTQNMTLVLITPDDIGFSLGGRRGLVLLSSAEKPAERYFHFENVDFSRCAPE